MNKKIIISTFSALITLLTSNIITARTRRPAQKKYVSTQHATTKKPPIKGYKPIIPHTLEQAKTQKKIPQKPRFEKKRKYLGFVRFADANPNKIIKDGKEIYVTNKLNQRLPIVLNDKAPTQNSNPVPQGFYFGSFYDNTDKKTQHVYVVSKK